MTDRQIVELYLQRDEDALTISADLFSGYCKTVAMHFLRSAEDAEEVLNDTWLAAWNSIPPQEPENLRTYLGKLTRNISLKRLREGNAQKRGASEVPVVLEEIQEWLASSRTVEQEISERMLTEAINAFLQKIPETECSIFVRRYWYFQSVSEIAAVYGFSESKVKSMLYRIRKKLYAELKKENLL